MRCVDRFRRVRCLGCVRVVTGCAAGAVAGGVSLMVTGPAATVCGPFAVVVVVVTVTVTTIM